MKSVITFFVILLFAFKSFAQDKDELAKEYFFKAQTAYDNGQYSEAINNLLKTETYIKGATRVEYLYVKTWAKIAQGNNNSNNWGLAKVHVDKFFKTTNEEICNPSVWSEMKNAKVTIDKNYLAVLESERLAKLEAEKAKQLEIEQLKAEKIALQNTLQSQKRASVWRNVMGWTSVAAGLGMLAYGQYGKEAYIDKNGDVNVPGRFTTFLIAGAALEATGLVLALTNNKPKLTQSKIDQINSRLQQLTISYQPILNKGTGDFNHRLGFAFKF